MRKRPASARASLIAVDGINAATSDMVRSRVAQVLDIRKALTPEEWEKLQAMWTERKDAGERGERARERRGERADDQDDE